MAQIHPVTETELVRAGFVHVTDSASRREPSGVEIASAIEEDEDMSREQLQLIKARTHGPCSR